MGIRSAVLRETEGGGGWGSDRKEEIQRERMTRLGIIRR